MACKLVGIQSRHHVQGSFTLCQVNIFEANLRFSPPSATSCCNFSCSPATYSFRWESSSTLQISSSLNLSNGSRFILRDPENNTGSCVDRWKGQYMSPNWMLSGSYNVSNPSILYLRDDCEPVSEVVQSYTGNIYTINDNTTFSSLNYSEQAVGQAWFSSSCAAYYTNLRAKRDRRRHKMLND